MTASQMLYELPTLFCSLVMEGGGRDHSPVALSEESDDIERERPNLKQGIRRKRRVEEDSDEDSPPLKEADALTLKLQFTEGIRWCLTR